VKNDTRMPDPKQITSPCTSTRCEPACNFILLT
jgi:hypothetical protein